VKLNPSPAQTDLLPSLSSAPSELKLNFLFSSSITPFHMELST
jgi:hypothetical protein